MHFKLVQPFGTPFGSAVMSPMENEPTLFEGRSESASRVKADWNCLLPLGSRLWCITVSLSLSHWYPRSGVVLYCIDS